MIAPVLLRGEPSRGRGLRLFLLLWGLFTAFSSLGPHSLSGPAVDRLRLPEGPAPLLLSVAQTVVPSTESDHHCRHAYTPTPAFECQHDHPLPLSENIPLALRAATTNLIFRTGTAGEFSPSPRILRGESREAPPLPPPKNRLLTGRHPEKQSLNGKKERFS